jgi:hypothetical protein
MTAAQATLPAALGKHSELEAAPEVALGTGHWLRNGFQSFRGYLRGPSPVPLRGALLQLLFGLAQPLVGARSMIRRRELLYEALPPAIAFAAVCATASISALDEGAWAVVRRVYVLLAIAAPLSPVLFTKLYARMAARARVALGHSPRRPYLRTIRQALGESFAQLLVLGIGLAPLTWGLGLIPVVGAMWVGLATGLWVLHWIFVEALDSSRTLPDGVEAAELDARLQDYPPPWFVRMFDLSIDSPLNFIFAPLRVWARILDRFTRRWRAEVAVFERYPWIASGFALGAAVVLVVPGLNLLFRAVVVVAGAHFQGQLELVDEELRTAPQP